MVPAIEPTFLSLVPPLVAIILALWSRQVYLSLLAGIWIGWVILNDWNPVTGMIASIDAMIGILADAGSAKVLVFTLVIGALIATVEAGGGVRGFVQRIEKSNLASGPRGARMVAFVVGFVIFIESNITILVSGAVARPLFDRYKRSREMLAYIIDSTSAPICILIPLNAWGAYVLTLMEDQPVDNALQIFLTAIPLNFYAIAALVLSGIVAYTGWSIGPMKAAEERATKGILYDPAEPPSVDEDALIPKMTSRIRPRSFNMIIPLAVMVLMMPLGLWITGGGNILAGSGSTSVLWAVLAGLATAWILLLIQRALTVDELTRIGMKGSGGMLGLTFVMLLAFSLGDIAREMGTGLYVAQLVADTLPIFVLLPLIFLTGAFISFSTGTSWGTFAIMVPLAVPVAVALGLPVAPFLAAALSGGIFGDHASPISDTTIVSSMAAATGTIAHVRTQLPYALMAAIVATVAFVIVGAML